MWHLVRRRLADACVVVWLVATLSFAMLHLAPGDPVSAALSDPRVPASVRAHWRDAYALDKPLVVQYVRYVEAITRGDLGYSFSQVRPVRDALAEALPSTLLLAGTALVSALLVGALLGTWQAVREGSLRERLSSLFVSGLSAVPDVWLGLLLLLVFGAELALFPMGGRCDAVQCSSARGVAAVLDAMRHLALPVLTLTLVFATPFARMQRVAVRDVLHDDVMRTARAKGVTTAQQVLHHAVRRSAHPLIASVGLSLPVLAGGTVLVERVFGWPGMGALLVNAVAVRDYPLVTASAMVGALLVVGGALLTDTLSASLDPRWRGALA